MQRRTAQLRLGLLKSAVAEHRSHQHLLTRRTVLDALLPHLHPAPAALEAPLASPPSEPELAALVPAEAPPSPTTAGSGDGAMLRKATLLLRAAPPPPPPPVQLPALLTVGSASLLDSTRTVDPSKRAACRRRSSRNSLPVAVVSMAPSLRANSGHVTPSTARHPGIGLPTLSERVPQRPVAAARAERALLAGARRPGGHEQ